LTQLPSAIKIENMENVNVAQEAQQKPQIDDITEITGLMLSATDAEKKLVEKSYTFAKEAHKDHKRLSGEPYFQHLFATAHSLAEIGMDSETIIAGLLHDSIEDAGVTREEIREKFGDEILFLVEGVTKLGELKYRGRERHVESLRRLLVATSQDIRVLLVKLYDRLHNMQTLSHVPKVKQKRIALETLEIYAPIADRLGIGILKKQLEDLSFPFVYPKEYKEVATILAQRTKHSEAQLERAKEVLRKELAKNDIRNFRTTHRIKGVYSLHKKLERKDRDPDRIFDFAALKVIVPSVSDCYKVLGVVHSLWKPKPGKLKDYIAFPKPNGYQSLHTTVFTRGEETGGAVEIQILTEDMHKKAQFGIASHFSYKDEREKSIRGQIKSNLLWFKELIPSLFWFTKSDTQTKDTPLPDTIAPKLSPDAPDWIREIAEAHDHTKEGEEFIAELKSDFFSHRVFVFTPQGDVVDLPVDSSPIDFAYAIHSDIGDHTAGAKVNGKLVSLDTLLKNGDIVEIATKNSAHPTQKWLEIARTSLARRHIQSTLAKLANDGR
jgi:GTP diphosphokinase / guanosine-3',5'-bis(diphosphate) 3'-diphosphatase